MMRRLMLALATTLALGAPGGARADESRSRIGGAGKAEDEAARRYFTDTLLTDQDGVVRRFYTDLIRGRKVLINFGFTTCKGVCPAMARNLRAVQTRLGPRASEVTILTITVDPVNDTPAALKRFAEQMKAGPGWRFLTGTPERVSLVLSRLGGKAPRPEEHSAVLLIGDARTGNWVKTSSMDRPEAIVALIEHLNDPR